jgi:hypothetical protein
VTAGRSSLICGSLWSNASEIATGFLKFEAYQSHRKNGKRGCVVSTQNNPYPDQRGFRTEDILWALGVWSVILSLSPVIVFYMLMVA